MKNLFHLLLLCFTLPFLFNTGAVAAEFDRFREIFPIPRQARYSDREIPVTGFSLRISERFDRERLELIAGDLAAYLERQWGLPFPIKTDVPGGFPVNILTPAERTPALKALIPAAELARLPQGERGRQSFIIRSTPDAVYIVANDTCGAAYALAGIIQLLRPAENHAWTFRGVDATDFPAFELRMGSAIGAGGKDAPVQRQQQALQLAGMLLRYNYGKAGYPGDTSQHQFAIDRCFLRLCSGYWNRPKGEPPLRPWNWSDPAVNQQYVDLALQYAGAPGVGAYFWHDVTDAGWWHVYIDDFWNKRDDLDRKNYPNDPSPARPDAIRFKAMFDALQEKCPAVSVIWTVPVYYDLPGKDDLKDVKNFREYLRLVAATVPQKMRDRFYVMLEERSPETVADYRKYMDNLKMCQYRYTSVWSGTTWDLNFTDAQKHDGKTEGYLYEASDPLAAIAAQYLWNPQLPTDEAWIVENVAPRALFLIFGDGWKEMLDVLRLNLNNKTIVKENNTQTLNARKRDAEKALTLLDAAEKKTPAANSYAHYLIGNWRTKLTQYLELVNSGLEKANQLIALDAARFTADGGDANRLRSAALSDGQISWSSGRSAAPHFVEIKLPGVYNVNRILIKAPGNGGYSWTDAEVQANFFGIWRKLAPITGRERLLAEFNDVRTDKIRLLFRRGWDWSKVERPDMILSGITLYGNKVEPDPPGTARLDGRWKFRLDPDRAGMGAKWFELREFPASEWHDITVPSHFEQSGIPGSADYDGQVWYAVTFPTPAGWEGKAVKLLFGAVDDEAEVFLNGQRLGLHTKEGENDSTWWEEPFRFDVTAALKPAGEENVLVVRVDDFTLEGGIWRSVFLHIGDGPGLYSGK